MMRRVVILGLMGIVLAASTPRPAVAGCGCDKPPPARAAVRPFAGHTEQAIALFDDRLVAGRPYAVEFRSADGSSDWSRGTAAVRRDLADGAPRVQLRVPVGSVGLGPCALTVWSNGVRLYGLTDSEFTVVPSPVALNDSGEKVVRPGYRAAVGRDGTVYVPVDVSAVDAATTFTGRGLGFPLAFRADSIAIYNEQGFLMQLLDPAKKGLFRMTPGSPANSAELSYWRHEFATYKSQHRHLDAWAPDDQDRAWHADGTYHVDHDHLLVAIRGALPNGSIPAAGATPPFTLVVNAVPRPQL